MTNDDDRDTALASLGPLADLWIMMADAHDPMPPGAIASETALAMLAALAAHRHKLEARIGGPLPSPVLAANERLADIMRRHATN